MTNNNTIPFSGKLHLILSILALVPIAIVYGTKSLVTDFFDIEVNTIDTSNMLRAIMCLYLAVCLVLFLGAWKPKYWRQATLLNVVFMLSLATGRALSMIMDGIPTQGYIVSIIVEVVLGLYSVYQIRKYNIIP